MSTTSVTIEADANGKPLEVLADLIEKRAQYLKGETTENAVTATTINVLKSLRADSKVAPLVADPTMIRVELVASNAAGWRHIQGKGPRRSPVVGGHWDRAIRPVNLMYSLNGEGSLFKITLLNPNLTPKKSLNKPVYYVLAPNEKVASEYGLARMTRALKKESGMSKYAIQMAAAKVYDKAGGEPVKPTGGSSKAFRVASDAVVVTKTGSGYSSGSFAIDFIDRLNYSALALLHGPSSVDFALKKAANSTAGIINHLGDIPLDQKIPTPFPEVSKSKASA